MAAFELVFYSSVFFIVYVYIGYPLLVMLLGRLRHRDVRKKDYEPTLTIVIAAYNEEECIASTLQNKLNLDYPAEKIEIIVVSDSSTDKTEKIVGNFAQYGVKLMTQGPRAGKTSALNLAIPLARGEIIVFSDANSMYAEDALRKIVRNFADPDVGYVTGKMIYTNPDGTPIGDGCSAYMKYENLLREYETRVGSVVGVDGGIDAMRKNIHSRLNPDQLPDFVQPLKVVAQGYRVVYEPEALLKEASLKHASDEYRMRVRVSLRALWALFDMRRLLLAAPKDIFFAWQLWSHKVLRYLCFIFLAAAYMANAYLLQQGGIYLVLFWCQNVAWAGACLSPFLQKVGLRVKLLYLLYYFALINIAAGHASIKFLMGKKQVIWNPRKG